VGGANSGKSVMVTQFLEECKKNNVSVSVLKEVRLAHQKNFLRPINIENPDDRINFMRNFDYDSPVAIESELLEVSPQ
jgi:hypothetical protein